MLCDYVHYIFITNFKWFDVIGSYWRTKNNFNSGFKLESIITYHFRFFVKVLWKYFKHNNVLYIITPPNNLLLNSYFKNFTVKLYILYVLNMHTNIHVNQLLFTIRFILSYFIYYFKLQKFEFKQSINNVTIDV